MSFGEVPPVRIAALWETLSPHNRELIWASPKIGAFKTFLFFITPNRDPLKGIPNKSTPVFGNPQHPKPETQNPKPSLSCVVVISAQVLGLVGF